MGFTSYNVFINAVHKISHITFAGGYFLISRFKIFNVNYSCMDVKQTVGILLPIGNSLESCYTTYKY